MDTLSFIARYETILKEKKIPKMTMYKECEITDAAVSQWRKGKTVPSMKSIERIANYLGVTTEHLLGAEKAPTLEGERQISDDDLKFALWGGTDDIDDDDLEDVRNYAAFVRERKKRQNK